MTSMRNLVWILALAIVALAFLRLSPQAARHDALLRNYAALLEVDALVRRHHVEAPEVNTLRAAAIDGLMSSLDPYSCYLDENAYAAYRRRLAGEDVGIGIELAVEYGRPTVATATEGEPAALAGLRVGDVILTIDGIPTTGLSALSIEGMLGGEPGTEIVLNVQRPPHPEPLAFTAIRRAEAATLVRGLARDGDGWAWMLDPADAIGYLRVTAFRQGTIEQIDAALDSLREQRMRGLVLDLRNNPGGLIPQATALVDRFVADGLIVHTVSREAARTEYTARSDRTDTETALAVLIDGASASAAELTAGALQDHGRAVVVGERSFGKGSVQYILELADQQTALRLTTAYYVLPKGRIVHRTPEHIAANDWGITPDIEVPLTAEERSRLVEHQAARAGRHSADEDPQSTQHILDGDPALRAALDTLRSRLGQHP